MNLDTAIIKAIDYSDNEDYQKAIDICTTIVDSNPNYDKSYFERAMEYLNLNKYNLAIVDFKKIIGIKPKVSRCQKICIRGLYQDLVM